MKSGSYIFLHMWETLASCDLSPLREWHAHEIVQTCFIEPSNRIALYLEV